MARAHPGMIKLRHEAENPGLQLAPEKHIFRHVQRVDKAKSLMKTTDAGGFGIAWRPQRNGLVIDFDAAGIRRLRTCKGFDQRRLASAVVPRPGPRFRRDGY